VLGGGSQSAFTARAMTYCDVFALLGNDLEDVASAYPAGPHMAFPVSALEHPHTPQMPSKCPRLVDEARQHEPPHARSYSHSATRLPKQLNAPT
jgi:hypothetical protein